MTTGYEARVKLALDKADLAWTALHTDCWSDPWKRVWCGMMVRFLDDKWRPQMLCIGFEHVATWTSPDAGSSHCAAPCATAIRAQLRKLKVGSPAWSQSDSANPAVAVGKALGMNIARCLVHIFAIASQRTLWSDNEKTDVVKFMDKCRAFALFLYKKEDLHAEWRRRRGSVEKVPGVVGQIVPPKPDSHAKWSSSLALVRNCRRGRFMWEYFHLRYGAQSACPAPLTNSELRVAETVEVGLAAVWMSAQ